MQIIRLTVENYRNYEHAEIEPSPRLTVLLGENAQGKTNLLEAAFYCAIGRSHRTAKDQELIRWEAQIGRIEAAVKRQDGQHEVQIALSKLGKKQIKVDGQPLHKMGELMGKLNAVLFSPEDLRLVKEGPQQRRRFMDIELSQVRPAYFYRLQKFYRALGQRNNLLKELYDHPELQNTLPAWDEQLSTLGAQVYLSRRNFVAQMDAIAKPIHKELSGSETLSLRYVSQLQGDDLQQVQKQYLNLLNQSRKEDIRRGVTLKGPHHDDIEIETDGISSRMFASQGQQRTVVLSLKLSQLQYIQQEVGEAPVLMLDDVFSELDQRRQQMLMKNISGWQTILTTTALDDAISERDRLIYKIREGKVL